MGETERAALGCGRDRAQETLHAPRLEEADELAQGGSPVGHAAQAVADGE